MLGPDPYPAGAVKVRQRTKPGARAVDMVMRRDQLETVTIERMASMMPIYGGQLWYRGSGGNAAERRVVDAIRQFLAHEIAERQDALAKLP